MNSDWYERDYRRTVQTGGPTTFLPETNIEIIQAAADCGRFAHVLFDFDGTLSLIREGWPEVMVPMMVEVLLETGTDETPDALRRLAYEFVMQLNGKQTIYQMIRLAEEVSRRGGSPEQPLVYKQRYHERLMDRIRVRREQLRSGQIAPETMLVPHSFTMLNRLRDRGLTLYLASGTDEAYVREEAELLGISEFFGPHVLSLIHI
jgi:phosphoglycolate phosphatase-like HAD superfamily hydrolase